PRARRRASASAASTASSDAASLAWCASSTRAMVSAIRPNRTLPSRNSATATSFAALNAVGAVPPAAAAARPSPYAGYSSARTGSKVRVPAATGSKRPARRRENEPRQLPRAPSGDALQHGAVLRVDRHDLSPALARGPGDELARHHERLLVGERHPLSRGERGERGLEPSGADNGVHDDLDVRARRGLDET